MDSGRRVGEAKISGTMKDEGWRNSIAFVTRNEICDPTGSVLLMCFHFFITVESCTLTTLLSVTRHRVSILLISGDRYI